MSEPDHNKQKCQVSPDAGADAACIPAAPAAKRRAGAEPLSFRVFSSTPCSPLLTGLIFTLGTCLVLIIGEYLTGRPARLIAGYPAHEVGCNWLVGDYRISLVGALLLGCVSTARYMLAESSHKNGLLLLPSEPFLDADRKASRVWWGLIPGVVGLCITFSIAIDISERPVEWAWDYWILPHAFNWFWCIPFGWIAGRFLYASLANGLLLSRRTRQAVLSSVLDVEVLEPALQHSKITAIALIVFLGGVSVHFLDPGAGVVSFALIFVLFAFALGVALVAVMGAQHVFANTREKELGQIREALREEREAALAAGGATVGRMESLLLLEQRVQGATLQVFRFSSLGRYSLYALLGLLSWLGAAAVERVLDAVLG